MASLKDTIKEIAEDREIDLPDHVIADLKQLDRALEAEGKAEEKTMDIEDIMKDLQREKHFDGFEKADWDKIERYLERLLH